MLVVIMTGGEPMPAEKVSMRQIREILRLKYGGRHRHGNLRAVHSIDCGRDSGTGSRRLARAQARMSDGKLAGCTKRWVGLGVIADNLVNISRAMAKQPSR